ncbi:MAG: flagellar hook protein FlgE [Treponema sp.]|jgi:flagellar hook protein FlgE|nr:flagellar hook protein FlgE [Treponema sp.]
MMRSLFSGVAGLQNHQTRMDVIGNNIANINTTGFKRNRVNFQDILYQQMQGASHPTEDLGGVNPKEVGLGMSIASIDTIHIQGSLQTTGVPTDLAIQGTGFFILQNGPNTLYTRAGAFSLDEDGTMVNPANGMQVQGWMAQDIQGTQFIDVSRPVENLIVPVGSKDPAKATEIVNFACNLDKRTPVLPPEGASELQTKESTWSTQIEIFDSFGINHILQIEFTKVNNGEEANNNTWRANVIVDPPDPDAPDAEENINPRQTAIGIGGEVPAEGEPTDFWVRFDNNGTLIQVADAEGNNIANAGQVLMNVAFNVIEATPAEAGVPIRQEFSLNLGTVGSTVNSITQFSESSSSKAVVQDGHTMGYLENFKIDQSGLITGIYSNGTTRAIGQVAMASFTNQGGLEKAGENTFRVSNNSGPANIGPSGIAGKGKIQAGSLEMSNVDMADQLTDMIITQRGFQVNSRTIQTADQLLQELLTLKR